MPVFEYRCADCGRRFSALVGMTAGPDDVRCPHCGGTPAGKLVSRPGRFRGEDARVEEVADRLEAMGEDADAASVRSAIREAGKALDDDAADDMEAMFESDQDGSDEE